MRGSWSTAAWLAVALAACANEPDAICPESATCGPEQETRHYFEQDLPNAVDVLFVVDDSSSMALVQSSLPNAMIDFSNVLKSAPRGMPDLHVALVSTSLGAGSFEPPGCPRGGARGVFQLRPRAKDCPLPHDGMRYLTSYDKGTKNNFDGDLVEAFGCIAQLGTGGCEFGEPLAAAARALGAGLGGWAPGAPAENAGFLRGDAFLALVFVTNKDDCSLPVDSDLFDPSQTRLSDPLGPLSAFRCAEFGHRCAGMAPPRTPATGLLDCHAAEDGRLMRVSEIVSFFRSLKPNGRRVIPLAWAGPPAPYDVVAGSDGAPRLGFSCNDLDRSATPSVRLHDFVQAFGDVGHFGAVCSDRSAVFGRFAKQIIKPLGEPCIEGVLIDRDPATPGVQPDCTVTDRTVTASGTVATPLPNCAVGGGGGQACWKLQPEATACRISGFEVKIDRGAQAPPPRTTTVVKCATCIDDADPRCRR